MTVLMLCRQLEDIPAGITHVLVLNEGQIFCYGSRTTAC